MRQSYAAINAPSIRMGDQASAKLIKDRVLQSRFSGCKVMHQGLVRFKHEGVSYLATITKVYTGGKITLELN